MSSLGVGGRSKRDKGKSSRGKIRIFLFPFVVEGEDGGSREDQVRGLEVGGGGWGRKGGGRAK